MNERVMQFRIGMFVIVAGLVLTMLIVWFGESPTLFREHVFVTVHYAEAPGVAEGIPVRKSGIRIGEVASIRFDERPKVQGHVVDTLGAYTVVDVGGDTGQGLVPTEQFQGDIPAVGETVDVMVNSAGVDGGMASFALPDGVLVTISLEAKYKLRAGSTPKISRTLIGDVSIDMLPGTGAGPLATSKDPVNAPMIEGVVAADPAKALAAATEAFEKVGGTLESIDRAAQGIASITEEADQVGPAIDSLREMGTNVGVLAKNLDDFIKTNESNLTPAIADFRSISRKLDATLDEQTQADFRSGIQQLNTSTAKLDKLLSDIGPLASDLGSPAGSKPKTEFGQVMMRLNSVTYDIGLLSQTLRGPVRGQLNTNGTLQKLLTDTQLYDNMNEMAIGAKLVVTGARPIIANFSKFAERIASDPSVISRGALQPR